MAIPTLTTAGWINDTPSMASKLMDYFVASDYSQSQLYRGNVASLAYLVQKYGDTPPLLADSVRETLRPYFAKHVDEIMISVATNDIDGTGEYNLSIDVSLTTNGTSHSLGKLIQISESEIINVTDATK